MRPIGHRAGYARTFAQQPAGAALCFQVVRAERGHDGAWPFRVEGGREGTECLRCRAGAGHRVVHWQSDLRDGYRENPVARMARCALEYRWRWYLAAWVCEALYLGADESLWRPIPCLAESLFGAVGMGGVGSGLMRQRCGVCGCRPRRPKRPFALLGRVGRRVAVVLALLVWAEVGADTSCRCAGGADPADEASRRPAAYVGGVVGTRRFAPGRWGLVGIQARNPTEQAVSLLPSVFFAEDPGTQFARRLEVPPRSQRRSWCLVRVPEVLGGYQKSAEVRTIAYEQGGAERKPLAPPEGGRWASHHVTLQRGHPIVGALFDRSDRPGDREAYQAIMAMQTAVSLAPEVADFWGMWLPPVPEGLDMLDGLVLAGDRLAEDAAARSAVRQWVRGGGRLWIMLDRVEPATVRRLLGEELCLEVVDRVGLTQVDVRDVVGETSISAEPPREFDDPVDLVRVLVSGVEILHSVNGWPASFRLPMGRGRVLVTTLGARGWIRPRGPGDPRPPGLDSPSHFMAVTPLRRLAGEFLVRSNEAEEAERSPRALAELLGEEVGYRVPGREGVLAIFAGFWAALLMAGVVLLRRNRLEHLGWLGPGFAAVAAAGLGGWGYATRHSIPPTAAVLQVAEADAGGEEIDVQGLLAIYHPEPSGAAPQVDGGGLYWPDASGLGGTIRRMCWTDLDAWHWEELRLPAGVRYAQLRQTLRPATRVEARGTFGPHGFSGTLEGPLLGVADAALLGPAGRLAVRLEAAGTFACGPGDELVGTQFLPGVLLSERQRRRQAVYQCLLSEEFLPERPRLYFWADLFLEGMAFPEQIRQAGAMLAAVPVKIQRSPPGHRVHIPAAFLPYRAVMAGDAPHASAYDNHARQWVALRLPAETWLRFQVPAEVLPLRIEQAWLVMELDVPGRRVEILGREGGEVVVLGGRQSPLGKVRFTLDRREALGLDARGRMFLGIRVGPDAPASDAPGVAVATGAAWKIASVALEIAGEVEPWDSRGTVP